MTADTTDSHAPLRSVFARRSRHGVKSVGATTASYGRGSESAFSGYRNLPSRDCKERSSETGISETGATMDSRRAFVAKMTCFAGGLAASSSRVLGANDRIRLGMIGPGFRGLQLIWSMRDPNAEFVAFADAYSGRLEAAKEMAKAPHAKTFADYRALLEDQSIDAVIIATPPHLHC